MTGTQSTADMFANMLMATGILIGVVAILVVLGLVVYHKTAGDSHETERVRP